MMLANKTEELGETELGVILCEFVVMNVCDDFLKVIFKAF